MLARGSRHGPARRFAPGERDGRDPVVGHQRLGTGRGNEKRLKRPGREAGFRKHGLDGEGAARHVGRMLQKSDVAGDQGRRGEPEYLPQGEVPGHDGEHCTEWLEAYAAFAGTRLHHLVREEGGSVLRVVAAHPLALVDFGQRGSEGLSHLGGHQAPELLAAGSQPVGRRREPLRPAADVQAGEPRLRRDGTVQEIIELNFTQRRVLLQDLPRSGVYALHGRRSWSRCNETVGRGAP